MEKKSRVLASMVFGVLFLSIGCLESSECEAEVLRMSSAD